MKKVYAALSISMFALSAFAAQAMSPWIASTSIPNFSVAVANLAKASAADLSAPVPIYFPKEVPSPKAGTSYFANSDTSAKIYNLYIDYTATCGGAKYCNALSLMIEPSTDKQKLSTYKDMQNHTITHKYYLGGDKFGNYTPGFAMGDYSNPQISWLEEQKMNGTKMYYTYTLSWVGTKSDKETRALMLDMARKLENIAPAISATSAS